MKGLILTYVLGYGGAAMALFQPLVGVIVYAVFSTARPQVLFGWAGDLSGMSHVVGVATLVGWAFKGFGRGAFGRAWPQVLLLLGFFVFTCASAAFAADQAVAWSYVLERSKIVLVFLVGITLIDSMAWVRRLAWALVLAQGYVAFEMNLSYLQGYNRAALDGLLGDNNSFAISMVAGLGPAVFLGLAAREWWKKAVAFTCAALILHTVILTFSRGGMLALVVTGAVVLVMIPKRASLLMAVAVTALLTVRLMGPEVTARFMTSFVAPEERDASAQSRVELWQACYELIRENPLTGVGPGHFPLVVSRFGWTRGKSAHSLWMQSAAELGVPAAACLLALYLVAMTTGLRMGRGLVRGDAGPHGLYVFSGLAGFVVAAQFVSIEGLELPYFIALVGAATLKILDQQPETPGVSLPVPVPIATVPNGWPARP